VNIARILITAVFGSLIAYYVGTIFTTQLITGTSTGDTLIQNIIPITLAAVAVIIIISVGFSRKVMESD